MNQKLPLLQGVIKQRLQIWFYDIIIQFHEQLNSQWRIQTKFQYLITLHNGKPSNIKYNVKHFEVYTFSNIKWQTN